MRGPILTVPNGQAAGLAYSNGPAQPTIVVPNEEELQRARIAHWHAWKAKRKGSRRLDLDWRKRVDREILYVHAGEEIELRHALLAKKELDDLEREHPGATERRKECEARRAETKEKEMKLVKDRHASTEPGMKAGRIPGWADKQAARREHEHAFDLEMEALEKKLGPAAVQV